MLRDDVGFDWLVARNVDWVSASFRPCSKVKGITITRPKQHGRHGLLQHPGHDPDGVSEKLAERGHIIRFVDQRPSEATARASTAWWCTEDEIDNLVMRSRQSPNPFAEP